uniref:Terpene synthase n=1 Tax=Oryza brachyantha TaxID=4533 RepID=J3LPZ0_ORYBR
MAGIDEVGEGRVIAQGYTVVDEERHAVDYRPSVWGDYFISNPTLSHNYEKSLEWMERRDQLINITREVFLDVTDPFAKMKLTDALQRLGVSYHFKEIIDSFLESLASVRFENDDFHAISLQFRLLRQERHYMPCDLFKEFIDGEGNLNATLCSDTRALLALYEAAHLGTPDEQILKEAQIQTTNLLREITADHIEKPLSNKVRHALETPTFRRMKRLEARLYIPLYQEDKEECNETILELAKLDFYLLQRLHQEEVKEICEWYHGLESPCELFYARHRPAESYFWALGVYYEPQHSEARKLLAKFIATITPYDDTFDNYGIWEELQPFADVMQRWDEKDAEKLEGYNKDYARFMFGTMNEIEDALPKGASSKNVNIIREIITEVCKGYVTEIGWRDSKYIPPLKEHLKITLVTCFYWAVNCTAFVVFQDGVTEEVMKWMSEFPQIVKDSCIVSRLMDDIVAHEFETERDNVATAVTCYMKEYNSTKEEACKALWNDVENAWKDMNQEYLKLTSIPSSLLILVINLARMMETMYKKIDGYTDSAILKEWISLLLAQRIPF